jgi:hypothetical protein
MSVSKEIALIVEKQKQIKTVILAMTITTMLYILIFLLQYYEMRTVLCDYDIVLSNSIAIEIFTNISLGLLSLI